MSGQTLNFQYNEVQDVLTVEGHQYSGELFRAWKDPDPKAAYMFERDHNGDLMVRKIEPIAEAADMFSDYEKIVAMLERFRNADDESASDTLARILPEDKPVFAATPHAGQVEGSSGTKGTLS